MKVLLGEGFHYLTGQKFGDAALDNKLKTESLLTIAATMACLVKDLDELLT